MVEAEANESREIARVSADRSALPSFGLTPRTLKEALELAKLLSESDIVPKDFRDKPGNVLVAVQMGAELGIAPMQALQSIAVVNGRPTLWGDAVLGIVQASGLLEDFGESWDAGKKAATCRVRRKGWSEPIVRTFSMADAERIEITSYDGNQRKTSKLAQKDTYRNYPERMCQMRARSWALRDGFPDVLKGLTTREEADDFPSEPRNVTPTAAEVPPRKSERAEATALRESDAGCSEHAGSETERSGVAASTVAQSSTTAAAGDSDKDKMSLLAELYKLMPAYNRAVGAMDAATKLMSETYGGVDRPSQLSPEQIRDFIERLKAKVGGDAK